MHFSSIDIHTHLNFAAFDTDRDAVIKRALDGNVRMINVGTQIDTSRKAVALAENYGTGVFAIVGLHPVHTSKSFHDEEELGEGGKEFTSRGEIFNTDEYLKLASHPKVVGIGECGLDYYRIENDELRIAQEKAFRNQIELAIAVKKPLMLHLRNGSGRSAYNDAFSILKSYLHSNAGLRGDLHFFAGSIEEAKIFLDIGFSFSFTGVITFARQYEEIVNYLPIERMMTETDSPYVAPVPYRGKRNEPAYVIEVVKKIAAIKKMDHDVTARALFENANNFFSLFIQ